MRGFDSCYPCIFNVGTYLTSNKAERVTVRIRQRTKTQSRLSKRLKVKVLAKQHNTLSTKRIPTRTTSKLRFNRKTRSWVRKLKRTGTPKQANFFRKRCLFRFFKFKRLRTRTFFFKNVKSFTLTKQNRRYSTTLKQHFRKRRPTRKQYTLKTRSTHLFSKIASMRIKAVNLYTKSAITDVRRLKKLLPLNYKLVNRSKSVVVQRSYSRFLHKLALSNVSGFGLNFRKRLAVLKNLAQQKNLIYANSQVNNGLSLLWRRRKMMLKTSRLLRRRLAPLTMSGAIFRKFTGLGYNLNTNSQTLYSKGGLFQLNYLLTNIFERLGSHLGLQHHWTNTWWNTTVKNYEFFSTLISRSHSGSTHLRQNHLTPHKSKLTLAPLRPVLKRSAATVVAQHSLNPALNKWAAPALRYGDATFFKKTKTSLRQLKQHLKTKNSYVPLNVSRLLDFKEKAVTEASFTRINSDDTIFADTEFANVISRLHKLPSTSSWPVSQSLFFKNTYPFYFFVNKNLNYLRSKRAATYNVTYSDTTKSFSTPSSAIVLSKNLLFFLWKIKILKPKSPLKKFYKREIQKLKPRKTVHKFFNRLLAKNKYKYFHSRRFFTSFFNHQLSKWKTFLFSYKNTHFLKKRNLSNKLFSDRRHFKWALPIKKNQKFFKRLELKINKDLRRKQVLYSYFKNRNNIETKPILRKDKFNNFTKNSLTDHFPQKLFLTPHTANAYSGKIFSRSLTSLFVEPYMFHLDYVNMIFKNPFLLKTGLVHAGSTKTMLSLVSTKLLILTKYFSSKASSSYTSLHTSNLVPHNSFTFSVSRKIFSFLAIKVLASRITPWYYNNIIRFIEDVTGRKVLFQFYPFMSQEVSKENIVRYKKWLPRMSYYERRLGHRFFLEESLHILHLGFSLKDAVLIGSWLKSMILRISFWKTKFIFRFLKYLFQNYFKFIFDDLSVKGLKIKLKGKISVAGNSRKRTILYRVGSTSHASLDLRVVNHFQTVNTFTGVMGLQVWVFY